MKLSRAVASHTCFALGTAGAERAGCTLANGRSSTVPELGLGHRAREALVRREREEALHVGRPAVGLAATLVTQMFLPPTPKALRQPARHSEAPSDVAAGGSCRTLARRGTQSRTGRRRPAAGLALVEARDLLLMAQPIARRVLVGRGGALAAVSLRLALRLARRRAVGQAPLGPLRRDRHAARDPRLLAVVVLERQPPSRVERDRLGQVVHARAQQDGRVRRWAAVAPAMVRKGARGCRRRRPSRPAPRTTPCRRASGRRPPRATGSAASLRSWSPARGRQSVDERRLVGPLEQRVLVRTETRTRRQCKPRPPPRPAVAR